MKIEKFIHKNVNHDGTFSDSQPGAVKTAGSITMSDEDGGCGLENCKCSEGHWMSIALPRTKEGIVEVTRAQLDNWGEMQLFLVNRELVNEKEA